MAVPKKTFDVFRKIASTCERETMIPRGAVVVAGVSGGVDSMFMLAFLDAYREKYGFSLLACHLNHMIRGADADLDERLVGTYCQEQSIPFIPVRVDVPAIAKTRGISLEEAGRLARRDTMTRLAGERAGATRGYRVAFAHHMDDRAESILMHIGRGSGLAGLIGIRYVDGVFIRPLLDVRLAEIESAAEALRLPWREDATNRSDTFLRNRVRHHLLPVWKEVLGYDPAPVLARLGDAAGSDEDALAEWAASSLGDVILPDRTLSVSALADRPKAIIMRVLALHYAAMAGETHDSPHSLGAVHLEDIYTCVLRCAGGEAHALSCSLPGGVKADFKDGRLSLVFPEAGA